MQQIAARPGSLNHGIRAVKRELSKPDNVKANTHREAHRPKNCPLTPHSGDGGNSASSLEGRVAAIAARDSGSGFLFIDGVLLCADRRWNTHRWVRKRRHTNQDESLLFAASF